MIVHLPFENDFHVECAPYVRLSYVPSHMHMPKIVFTDEKYSEREDPAYRADPPYLCAYLLRETCLIVQRIEILCDFFVIQIILVTNDWFKIGILFGNRAVFKIIYKIVYCKGSHHHWLLHNQCIDASVG